MAHYVVLYMVGERERVSLFSSEPDLLDYLIEFLNQNKISFKTSNITHYHTNFNFKNEIGLGIYGLLVQYLCRDGWEPFANMDYISIALRKVYPT